MTSPKACEPEYIPTPSDAHMAKAACGLIDAVNQDARMKAWLEQQFAKIAAQDEGTYRERRDKDGNLVPYFGQGGWKSVFEYTVCEAAVVAFIKIRCTVTGDELDLTPPADCW